ncbi:hypothetical protein HID58_088948, partial [Brassica napus]
SSTRSSHSHLRDLQTRVVARRSNHPKAFYLLSNVCSHMFWLNEYDDCMRSLGFHRLQIIGLDTVMWSSEEAKLELEIHLVSSISFVEFKADCASSFYRRAFLRDLLLQL